MSKKHVFVFFYCRFEEKQYICRTNVIIDNCMKRFVLFMMSLTSLGFSANSQKMYVESTDGKIVTFNVENVNQVYFDDGLVSVNGRVGEYTYVDLGLPSGMLWATCNVGAAKSYESGFYFAWGETTPREIFSWENYLLCEGEKKQKKYVSSVWYGNVDGKTVLEAEDDAATVNWGEGWRMPTAEEQQELINGCTWKLTDNFKETGVAGQVGTSKTNGNIIFIPLIGKSDTGEYVEANVRGDYWSSSLDESKSSTAYFTSAIYGEIKLYNLGGRYVGRGVRAVVAK